MVNWPFADLVNKNAQDIVHNQHYSYMTMIQDKVEPFIKKKQNNFAKNLEPFYFCRSIICN